MVISLCTANNTITLSITLSNPAIKQTVASNYMNMEMQLITWFKKQKPYCCYGVDKNSLVRFQCVHIQYRIMVLSNLRLAITWSRD